MGLTNETRYYEHGFFSSKISKEINALLWTEVYSTNWVTDTNEQIYKQIPNWYKDNTKFDVGETGSKRKYFERESGQNFLLSAPETLTNVVSSILKLPDLDFFNRYYNSYKLMYLDLWNGSEDIPYHFDTINGADTLILVYLTEQQTWQKEWGGQISLQKKVDDVIIVEQEFDPISQTMLVINNSNPLIKHKVTALKNLNVNRYTFSFNIKWF